MKGNRGDDGTRVLRRGNESLEAVELLDDDGGNRPWAVSSPCFIHLLHRPSSYLILEAHIRFGGRHRTTRHMVARVRQRLVDGNQPVCHSLGGARLGLWSLARRARAYSCYSGGPNMLCCIGSSSALAV